MSTVSAASNPPTPVSQGVCDPNSAEFDACETGYNLCVAVPANASDPLLEARGPRNG